MKSFHLYTLFVLASDRHAFHFSCILNMPKKRKYTFFDGRKTFLVTYINMDLSTGLRGLSLNT